jgi:hypothetical protein
MVSSKKALPPEREHKNRAHFILNLPTYHVKKRIDCKYMIIKDLAKSFDINNLTYPKNEVRRVHMWPISLCRPPYF